MNGKTFRCIAAYVVVILYWLGRSSKAVEPAVFVACKKFQQLVHEGGKLGEAEFQDFILKQKIERFFEAKNVQVKSRNLLLSWHKRGYDSWLKDIGLLVGSISASLFVDSQ